MVSSKKRLEPLWSRKRRRISLARRMLTRAMQKAGHTYRDIGRALDISISSVHLIIREGGDAPEQLANEIRKRSVSHHRVLAEQILSSIDDRDIKRATLKTKVISAAILTDKALLLEQSEAQAEQPRLIEQAIEHAESTKSIDNSGT